MALGGKSWVAFQMGVVLFCLPPFPCWRIGQGVCRTPSSLRLILQGLGKQVARLIILGMASLMIKLHTLPVLSF